MKNQQPKGTITLTQIMKREDIMVSHAELCKIGLHLANHYEHVFKERPQKVKMKTGLDGWPIKVCVYPKKFEVIIMNCLKPYMKREVKNG